MPALLLPCPYRFITLSPPAPTSLSQADMQYNEQVSSSGVYPDDSGSTGGQAGRLQTPGIAETARLAGMLQSHVLLRSQGDEQTAGTVTAAVDQAGPLQFHGLLQSQGDVVGGLQLKGSVVSEEQLTAAWMGRPELSQGPGRRSGMQSFISLTRGRPPSVAWADPSPVQTHPAPTSPIQLPWPSGVEQGQQWQGQRGQQGRQQQQQQKWLTAPLPSVPDSLYRYSFQVCMFWLTHLVLLNSNHHRT